MSEPTGRPSRRVAALLFVLIAGTGSGCSSRRATPLRAVPFPSSSPIGTALVPRPESSRTAADPRAAEAAVVRQYFRIINHLDTDMNADGLAALMTPACRCRKLERSVRDEAAHRRRYFGTVSLNRVQAHLDGPALGDILVDFDATVGGVRAPDGGALTRTPARRHVNWDFVLVRRNGHWLINQINQT